MRRNFDYVGMAYYQADMKETADAAAAIIADLKKRVAQAERALAETVLAAGGKVEIPMYELQRPDSRFEFMQERNYANMTLVFKARRL